MRKFLMVALLVGVVGALAGCCCNPCQPACSPCAPACGPCGY